MSCTILSGPYESTFKIDLKTMEKLKDALKLSTEALRIGTERHDRSNNAMERGNENTRHALKLVNSNNESMAHTTEEMKRSAEEARLFHGKLISTIEAAGFRVPKELRQAESEDESCEGL